MNTNFEWSQIPGWLQIAIIAFAALQYALEIYALIVLLRTPEERLVTGKRWIWVLVILLGSLIGTIVFFVAGRKPADAVDPLAQDASAAPIGDRAARAADVLYGGSRGDRK